MRVHFDVLAWLFIIMGATGVLTAVSLVVLAAGTAWTIAGGSSWTVGWSHPLATVFLVGAGLLLAGGGAMLAIGRALDRRRPRARAWALAAGGLNLCVLPFGTAFGVYAFWVLLNDEARREFGVTSSR